MYHSTVLCVVFAKLLAKAFHLCADAGAHPGRLFRRLRKKPIASCHWAMALMELLVMVRVSVRIFTIDCAKTWRFGVFVGIKKTQ